jgi:hypothetical protein
MQAAGYDGIFKARTATGMERADGSAIFWRREKFHFIDRLDINYCIFPHPDRKDNVGCGVLLLCKEPAATVPNLPPRYLAVVNTHLLYNPKRGDLKIGQMQILMNSVDAWLTQFSRREVEKQAHAASSTAAAGSVSPPHIALMLVGDFNAMPGSTLLQLALHGSLDLDAPATLASNVKGRIGLKRHHIDGQEAHDAQRALQQGMADAAAGGNAAPAAQLLTSRLEVDVASAHSSASVVASSSSLLHSSASVEGARKRSHAETIDLTGDSDASPDEEQTGIEPEDEECDDEKTMLELAEDAEAAAAAREVELRDDEDNEQFSDEEAEEELPQAPLSVSSAAALFPPASFLNEQGQFEPVSTPARSAYGRGAPNEIHSFFPFNASDAPRRIGHALQLRSVFVDKEGMAMRQRVEACRKGEAAPASTASLRVDPLTGVPLRIRPTSHHWRFSGQVDHMLFAPRAFQYRPEAWSGELGETPEQVCRARISEQQRRLQQREVDVGASSTPQSAFASSASSAAAPAVRITSILELPPLSTFQPAERKSYIRVAQQSQVPAAAMLQVQQQVPAAIDYSSVASVDGDLRD